MVSIDAVYCLCNFLGKCFLKRTAPRNAYTKLRMIYVLVNFYIVVKSSGVGLLSILDNDYFLIDPYSYSQRPVLLRVDAKSSAPPKMLTLELG